MLALRRLQAGLPGRSDHHRISLDHVGGVKPLAVKKHAFDPGIPIAPGRGALYPGEILNSMGLI